MATAAGPSSGACTSIRGHEAGADVVKARLRDAASFGIKELTVYSFSTENWNRSKTEVSGLMRMFARRIDAETPELKAEGVRMRFIGRRAAPVSPRLIEKMEWAEAADRRATTGSRCSSPSTTVVALRSSMPHGASRAVTRTISAVTYMPRTCTIPT